MVLIKKVFYLELSMQCGIETFFLTKLIWMEEPLEPMEFEGFRFYTKEKCLYLIKTQKT